MDTKTNTRLNVFEIFEIAEHIEKNGAEFYLQAAERVKNDNVRQTLMNLSSMEQEHEKIFAAMREELLYDERKLTLFDPVNEIAISLRKIADSNVFDLRKEASEQLAGKENQEQILRKAIELEKDSIIFYLGVKELVAVEAGRDKVDSIIRQELGHIKDLAETLEQIKA